MSASPFEIVTTTDDEARLRLDTVDRALRIGLESGSYTTVDQVVADAEILYAFITKSTLP